MASQQVKLVPGEQSCRVCLVLSEDRYNATFVFRREAGMDEPCTNPNTLTLLPTPSAIVNNRTSESPGVRTNALAELRIVSSPLESATTLILSENLLRLSQCSS